MKTILGCLMVLGLMGLLHSLASAAGPAPLPGCTVQMVEAGLPQCDPQAVESGGSVEDVDAADCSVEGECQGTATGNPESEGPFDAAGDDTGPDHG